MHATACRPSRTLTYFLLLALLAAGLERGHAQGGGGRGWTDYGGDSGNARHVPLTQITKSNLDQLDVAWTYPTNDTISYVFNPVVVDNVMYVLARNNSLVALDATTGKEIWIHEGLEGIAPRGINYWESKDRSDRRLLFQMNSYLQAIDARTGKIIPSFGKDGAVNLREGLGRDPATIVKTQSSNPGKIFENLIILGSAPGENYMAPPGDLRAYDVVTGKLAWQFHTIPHPGEYGYDTWPKDAYKYIGGVNTWGELTVDAERGIAYFPLGSPTYDFYGADRPGANLYGTSLLALNARTGKRLWHFQMVHHDLWDYDNTAAPQLATIRRNGKTIDVVAQAGKTGFLYVFDRVTGTPIWPIEERRVPRSEIPGEEAWPTQPFPTAPPPFAPQKLTAADINPYILTAEEQETWKTRISNARNEGLFTPPSLKDTVSIPGAQGGANWGTTASDPARGIVYVLSINVPSIYKLSTEAPTPGGGRGAGPAAIAEGRGIYDKRCQTCHGPDLRGSGNYPSLVDITSRLGPEPLRDTITGGRPGMPANNDLTQQEIDSLIGFLGSPNAAAAGGRGRGTPPPMPPGPVVASGGSPAGRVVPPGRAGGMIGPAYPEGIKVPEVRMYTGYGMNGTIVKPPYSTLTAYDLNTGTIKWQVPAGGDDPRAVAQGAANTGYISARTGIITTPTGLLFHAGGDGKLRIYDSETGSVLKTLPLPAGSRGIPAMYEANGRQFLVVNATSLIERARTTDPEVEPARAYVAFALRETSVAKNFLPDETFRGSTLAGWTPIGDAKWRANQGEITGAGSNGWLVADRSYQDVAVSASFRCPAGCKTGVLLRAEKMPDGGMKGIFVSLNEGDLASYRLTVDAKGVETSRERLRAPGPGQLRVAPPPAAETAPAAPAGRGGPPPIPQMPGGIASPIPPPVTGLRAGDWNTIELVLDANILRAFLNDAGGIRDGVAEQEYGRYGPFALYVGGTGEVRFKDIAYKDLQPRVALPEEVSSRFRMQTLNEFYYSWGPAVSDINHDGLPDIVAGPYYYLGPTYNTAREIYVGGTIDPGTAYFNGLQYTYDFTGDGWPDVLNSVFQRPAVLYVNPKGESRRWDSFTVTDRMTCEFMLLKDIDGDGKLEFIFKDSENVFVYAKPDPANPTGMWVKHAISEPGPWANHGMGVGDVNGDGRTDFLNAFGWWEQPASLAQNTRWTYHPVAFGKWNRSSPGGAEMAVYDVNGDGLNDVVTSLQAHGWGLSWFEQKKGADGARTFVEHPIMGDFSTTNAGGVTFSELHGATYADIDGDGLNDFITGKRFWSHLDTFLDPDPHGPPVLYVYRAVRNPKAPGGAEFVPELIHNRSGVGSHVAVYDLNGDRRPEIITSTKRGTFVFWNEWKK